MFSDNYLTREEACEYARVSDLVRVRESAISTITETENLCYDVSRLEDGYTMAIGRPEECSTYGVGGYVRSKFDNIEYELMQVKEVLIELQMTLRTLGLDDMSKRLGDLDLLLT